MTDHLSIEIPGLLHGVADGPLAIATLAAIAAVSLIVIAATTPRWWRR